MRKIVMFNRITLDGFFAGAHDEIDWFVMDPEVDKTLHEVMRPDTVLFGRKTYEMFASYWPHVKDNPSAHEGERAMSQELSKMTKVVFSKSVHNSTWENSLFFKEGLVEEVENLKQAEGGDIAIFGSGSIVQQLATKGLIDEYLFVVTPVALGAGKTLFDGMERTGFALVDTKAFKKSGNVLLHYKKGMAV